MHIDQIQNMFKKRSERRDIKYILGKPATKSEIALVEENINIELPEQVKLFWKYYNGISVQAPSMEIFSINQLKFIMPNMLWFGTMGEHNKLCFNTSRVNEAGEWNIISGDTGYLITKTMASLWSNKIWAWIDKQKNIFGPFNGTV